jgi:uncharacterized repeat protein (TIGR03806 family)
MRAVSLSSLALLGTIALGTLAATAAGCGETASPYATEGDDTDGGATGDGSTPPTVAPFGLDTRPTNATCLAPARPADNASAKLERVFTSVKLSFPTTMKMIPGNTGRWFVTEKGGRVVSFAVDASGKTTDVNPRVDLDIVGQVDNGANGGETGLLGMAFSPKFSENGYVYLSYSLKGPLRAAVTRYTSAAKNGTSFGAPKDLFTPFDDPATNHNGGELQFGADGYLYMSFGDGGGAGDGFGHGQDTNSFFSKILRVDVNGTDTYKIPDGNPFKGQAGKKGEIYAYGFRNPYRFSFDKESTDLWVGDVGQDQWEEVDKVKLGANYGWSKKEGNHCYPSGQFPCPVAGLADPVHEYNPGTNSSVIGGYVYRGTAIPGLVGAYIFGDYNTKEVWALSFDPVTGKEKKVAINGAVNEGWFGFAQDPAGEVYALSGGANADGGKVYKVVPNAPATSPTAFPDKLSKTGCFDAKDPTKPAAGVIPFGVQSALWSDGAEKERFLALPDGKTIHVNADNDFELPISTVLIKTFMLGGKRVETRLLVRHADGEWGGYSYEWDDAQTDATLLPANKTKVVGNDTWYFPSRAECFQCHTTPAGRSLGLEIAQQNGDFVYTSTNRLSNQLKTFDHIGLFDASVGDVASLPAMPTPTKDGDLEPRARAYLHSNCSHCHRPDGGGRGAMDFRFSRSFAETKSCNADPQAENLGVANAKIITPGQPTKSILSLRVHAVDAKRMPPLGVAVGDAAGLSLLDQWISSLTSCPTPVADGGKD